MERKYLSLVLKNFHLRRDQADWVNSLLAIVQLFVNHILLQILNTGTSVFLSKWSDEENMVTNTTKIESLNATQEAKSDRIGKSNF